MKIETTKTVKTKEIIDVKLPFYYTSIFDFGVVGEINFIWGKIEKNKHTYITHIVYSKGQEETYSFSIEKYDGTIPEELHPLFKKQTSEMEYLKAKETALNFIKEI